MTITENHKKESFSQAYVKAISSMAGAIVDLGSQFDYGIDASFSQVIAIPNGQFKRDGVTPKCNYKLSGTKFLAQIKCSHELEAIGDDPDSLRYKLKKKNYDDLICVPGQGELQKILLVVHVPRVVGARFDQNPERLIMSQTCYWINLSGMIADARSKVPILIPKRNIFTPEKINTFFQQHRAGQQLS